LSERVLEEIEYRLFSRPSHYVAAALYLAANALMYLVYLPEINRPDPTVGGLSVAFAYSLGVWVLLMVAVLYASLVAWRE